MGEAAFDRQVEKDWWRFKRGVAVWLSDAPAPCSLRIEVPGGAGTAQVHARLLVEDDGAWVMFSLGSRPRDELHAKVVAAGYRPVLAAGSARARRVLPGEYVDHSEPRTHHRATGLAVRLMTVLRELGALHPAMLTISAPGDQDTLAPLAW